MDLRALNRGELIAVIGGILLAILLFLAWIIIRGPALYWPRGELTAVVGVTALVLTLFPGVIDKPGSPADQISIDLRWGLALTGWILMIIGAAWRSQESAPRRKPPGLP
jgi:hypothetical protein